MKYKMKQLAVAVGVALGGLSMAPSVQAVSIATDKLGQALIIPYYTMRDGWNTLLHVTNTSSTEVVAVKLRFRESYNSRDVLDVNLFLSPNDVWTGWAAAPNGVPGLYSVDNSCVVGSSSTGQIDGVVEFPLRDRAVPTSGSPSYTGSSADGGPTDTNRMLEGHVEMIMMGSATVAALPTTAVARGALHNLTTGAPANCGALWLSSTDSTPFWSGVVGPPGTADVSGLKSEFAYNGNPLRGSYSLVNGGFRYSAAATPVTLANFWDPTVADAANCAASTTAGGTCNLLVTQLQQALAPAYLTFSAFQMSWNEPTLSTTNTLPAVLTPGDAVLTGNGGVSVGADSVSYVLAHINLINEWSRSPNTALSWTTATDWVISYPTKNFYVDNQPGSEYSARAAGRVAIAGLPAPITTPLSAAFPGPFTQTFVDTAAAPPVTARGRSCDNMAYRAYNREEVPLLSGASPTNSQPLCYETNVVTFNNSDTLGAALPINISLPSPNTTGWMNLRFFEATALGDTGTAMGLPVVGFQFLVREGSQASDASQVEHSYISSTAR